MLARIATTNLSFCHAVTVDQDQNRVFVHQSDCEFRVDDCHPGDLLDIGRVEEVERGFRAREVRWVRRPDADEDAFTEGTIVHVDDRMFAFMRPDGSPATGSNRADGDVLCHVTSFADYTGGASATFAALDRGDRVAAVVRTTSRGQRGAQIRRVKQE